MDNVPTREGRGTPCIFRVVRVSGTIRKAEEEAIRQAKQRIIAAKEAAMDSQSLLKDTQQLSEDAPLTMMNDSEDQSMDDAGD